MHEYQDRAAGWWARRRPVAWALLLWIAGPFVPAQGSTGGSGETATVHLRVVQVAGRSVYFDQGRLAGIVPGVRVTLAPVGEVPYQVRILAASSRGSRAEVPVGHRLPRVGSPCQAQVEPAQSPAPGAGPTGRPGVPEHPPWSADDSGFTQDSPLLSTARSRRRRERPTRWRGREFLQYQYTTDRGGDRDNTYQLGRLGVELEAENPFGRGGELNLEVDLDRRGTDLLRGEDRDDSRVRLDRLSYAWGLEQGSPHRGEVGRFLSSSVPELGLIDGVEASLRVGDRYRVGGGFGTAPEPLPSRDTGDDLGVHLFAELESTPESTLAGLLAVQKTWHRGRDDRDQLFGRVEWTPDETWRLWSSFRVDVYDSSDDLKGSGVELTELWVQGRWLPRPDRGLALSGSRYRWAELRRDEVLGVSDELVRNALVDRLDLSGWLPVAAGVKLRLRGGLWEDQERDGSNGEVGFDVDEFLDAKGFLHLSAHYADGGHSSGPSLRARYSRTMGTAFLSLGYEANLLRTRGFGGDHEDAHRHVARIGLDFNPFDDWDASVAVERSFGDLEDSYAVTLFLQHRF